MILYLQKILQSDSIKTNLPFIADIFHRQTANLFTYD